MLKRHKIKCDLCVVGGGMSGLCAAISATREGLSVVLMNERPFTSLTKRNLHTLFGKCAPNAS